MGALHYRYAKQTITDLLMNRLDISHLVISKSVSKSAEEYGSKQVCMQATTHTQGCQGIAEKGCTPVETVAAVW